MRLQSKIVVFATLLILGLGILALQAPLADAGGYQQEPPSDGGSGGVCGYCSQPLCGCAPATPECGCYLIFSCGCGLNCSRSCQYKAIR